MLFEVSTVENWNVVEPIAFDIAKALPLVGVCIERVESGEEVPSPSLPVVPSKWKEEMPALPKSTVVDAERPFIAKMREEVAAAVTPKLLVHVNGLAAPALV